MSRPDASRLGCDSGTSDEHGDAAEPLRLLCDEMLLGLGRWLRIAGYDAGYDTSIATAGMSDDALVALAAAERRMLLTCDRRLAVRAPHVDVLTLPTEGLDAAAVEVRERIGVDWLRAPFTPMSGRQHPATAGESGRPRPDSRDFPRRPRAD